MTMDGPPPGASGDDEPDLAVPSMGTMVIRTWTEANQIPGFRARLTYSLSPASQPETVYAADPDEVLKAVRQWLLAQSEAPQQP
jgi:hypothetical protein